MQIPLKIETELTRSLGAKGSVYTAERGAFKTAIMGNKTGRVQTLRGKMKGCEKKYAIVEKCQEKPVLQKKIVGPFQVETIDKLSVPFPDIGIGARAGEL
jgi:hypothetical protein